MGYIFPIIGPSASGKSTIESLLENTGYFIRIPSCTTRGKRENELEGIHYFFKSMEYYRQLAEADDKMRDFKDKKMTARGKHSGNFYWIEKSFINLEKYSYVCTIEPQGYYDLLLHYPGSVIPFYVYASDKERLLRSLKREINPNVDKIVERYLEEKKLFEDFKKSVKYVFDNSCPSDVTAEKILTIIKENYL